MRSKKEEGCKEKTRQEALAGESQDEEDAQVDGEKKILARHFFLFYSFSTGSSSLPLHSSVAGMKVIASRQRHPFSVQPYRYRIPLLRMVHSGLSILSQLISTLNYSVSFKRLCSRAEDQC